MTFRRITFIFIALLLSSLLLLQFWLIQSFTKDVSSKIGEAAFEVSRSTIETLIFNQPDSHAKTFAISTRISSSEQDEIIRSFTNIPRDVNLRLGDGQVDTFITLQSAGLDHKIDIPRTGIEKSLESMSQKILLSAIAFIFAGLLAASFFSKRLAKPLKDIELASKHVGRGEFGFQVSERSQFQSIEMKQATRAFNEMSLQIDSLRQQNEKLQKQAQLSELSEITRGLAHTIRNPLNTLNLAIDEMSTNIDEKSKLELKQISKHQIKRIDGWVRSLMDVLSNNDDLIESTDLSILVKEVISDIKLGLTTNTNIQIIFEDAAKNENNSNTLKVIQPEIKSILQGLITNAVESMFENSSSKTRNFVKIIIQGKQKKSGAVRISIIDCGKGMENSIRNKLFSPHNTNKTYGAGMGLYLAHRIVTLKYDGQINVSEAEVENNQSNSSSNNGTKVVLTLKNRV